jgi:hypothetical protein
MPRFGNFPFGHLDECILRPEFGPARVITKKLSLSGVKMPFFIEAGKA